MSDSITGAAECMYSARRSMIHYGTVHTYYYCSTLLPRSCVYFFHYRYSSVYSPHYIPLLNIITLKVFKHSRYNYSLLINYHRYLPYSILHIFSLLHIPYHKYVHTPDLYNITPYPRSSICTPGRFSSAPGRTRLSS